MHQPVDAHSPISIRRQLTEPRKHVIEGGRTPRNQTLSSIRELVGFLGIEPSTRVRAIEDLKRSGYRPLLPLTTAAPSPIARGPSGPGRHAGDPVL
jgi:DNA-binding transcriptional MocR family regulator